MGAVQLDTIWMLFCVGLVFAMQVGFLCLESGLTRSKDAINVALKNMADFAISFLLFWAFGFALMFGVTWNGWIGTTNFLISADGTVQQTTTFLFQAMFCATAATIVSGAVSGRMRFSAYMIVVTILSGLIYPLYGHWAWAESAGGPAGWLARLGFVDFAGATVVHSVGGWAALAAAFVIGPRAGVFKQGRAGKDIPASSLPFAMLGAMLLWMGWIGFNGGSTLAFNDSVPVVLMNTYLGGSAGLLGGVFLSRFLHGRLNVYQAINSSLAGLVAITASCHAVSGPAAVVIGIGGAIAMQCAELTLRALRIDDAISAMPVHAAAGVWGTVAVAIFGDPSVLGTGLSIWSQFKVQLIGAAVACGWASTVTYVLLKLASVVFRLRVSPEEEGVGLNVVEHGAATELDELISEMEQHRETGDFSTPVSVESFSEVGQIGEQYNRVLSVVNRERRALIESNRRAKVANTELHRARESIESQMQELTAFNELAVDRELRMIELKLEVNSLCEQIGLTSRYEEIVDESVELSEEALG